MGLREPFAGVAYHSTVKKRLIATLLCLALVPRSLFPEPARSRRQRVRRSVAVGRAEDRDADHA
jgi:hypothetical protein